jgi:hypothetical protein
MPFYLVFIICLYCAYHVPLKSMLSPVHGYSCRIADRDTSAFSNVGRIVIVLFGISQINRELFHHLAEYGVFICLSETCRLLYRQRIAVHVIYGRVELLGKKITFAPCGMCIKVESAFVVFSAIYGIHTFYFLSYQR